MAIGPFFQMNSRNKAPVKIEGSFAPNGSSAVASASIKGNGFSVARTSAGLFTITFDDKFTDLMSFTHGLQLATADDKYTIAGVFTAASKTITITVWDISGAAATDVSANANNRIHFSATFNNTSAALAKG
jgi:predicted flavoprotein YhiN